MKNNIGSRLFSLILIIFLGCIFIANKASARENVTDWYIKSFDSRIIVNKDSSLDITETILADCGTAPDKHGISRILPEKINIDGKGKIKTPIELISIKDANGKNYDYSESENVGDGTITWKIGDANKTVQGENLYVIKYKVKNAIRFWNSDFDELYWNLTGNFWKLEIDKAHIEIIFPQEVKRENGKVDVYSGYLGDKGNDLAAYAWSGNNVLEFDSIVMLAQRQGISVSVTFPRNIFHPYQPTFWERYGAYSFLLIPLITIMICFKLWRKYGDDPDFDKTVIAEYEAPKNMSPIETGLLMTNGRLKNHFITAEIIYFATHKILTINEIEDKILFFSAKNYEFVRVGNTDAENTLNSAQKVILDSIFKSRKSVRLSSLKDEFYKIINTVKNEGNNLLIGKNLIAEKGLSYNAIFLAVGIVLMSVGMVLAGLLISLGMSLLASGVIVLIFSFFMPRRTLAGAEMNWKIKGFKLFMETVDKDRAQFYEEENIFEKFLPYAVLFEITDLWIKKIKEIYGEDYFKNYAPVWYAGNLASFNADSFSSTLSGLSSSIAANTSAPSGSGGSGGSGGGGGGGGGGGW